MARTGNPLRFGFTVGVRPFDETVALCRAAEEAGFETIAFTDRPPESNLEAWTLATAVGVLTRRAILTHATLNVPFRNPALTAKMAATLDVITGGGRVQLTLGAGGQNPHYRAFGINAGSNAERFAGLRDAIAIMRGLWGQESFSYQGRVYRVENVTLEPRPVRGTIPIWIGALGPQMMRYTGAVADGWMKNQGWPESLEQLRGLVRLLEEGAERANRDPRTVRRVLNGGAYIGDKPPASTGDPGAAYVTAIQVQGRAEDIIATLQEYQEEGIDTFHFRFPRENTEEQLRRFGAEVIARLRGH